MFGAASSIDALGETPRELKLLGPLIKLGLGDEERSLLKAKFKDVVDRRLLCLCGEEKAEASDGLGVA